MYINHFFSRLICAAVFSLMFFLASKAQLRQLSVDSNNIYGHINRVSFFSPAEGYLPFSTSIAFTADSGHNYIKKEISRINYNGYLVSNPLTFLVNGVQAFDKDHLVVFGHFALVPAILYSEDAGQSYILVYYSQYDPFLLSSGVTDMIFPTNGKIGYAVDADRILKTIDKGKNWYVAATFPNSCFDHLYATSDQKVVAFSDFDVSDIAFPAGRSFSNNKVIQTADGGSNWTLLNMPQGFLRAFSNGGSNLFANVNNSVYISSDDGENWQERSMPSRVHNFQAIHFVNDSTGYCLNGGYKILKTTDYGKIWERIPTDYSFNTDYGGYISLFFYTQQQFWASGYYSFLAINTNPNGVTIPNADFNVDLSSIENGGIVNLVNYSKTGYSYKWYVNSNFISQNFSPTYISTRLAYDTITLIVTNGIYTDTQSQIIDTRADQRPCFSSFTVNKSDTSTIKCVADDSSYGSKHIWYFGDGFVDSTGRNVQHGYKEVAYYTIRHIILNTITHCVDSSNQVVVIYRIQKCLKTDFSYTIDTFLNNKLTFNPTFDTKLESSPGALDSVEWNFGDGYVATGNNNYSPIHTFDSAKYYNVCLTGKNEVTGCRNTICKAVRLSFDSACDAKFILNLHPTQESVYPHYFFGKPNSRNSSKKNIWIFDNRDTIVTGNINLAQRTYFKNLGRVGSWDDDPGYSCDYKAEIHIDSLTRTVKHIQIDSLASCYAIDSIRFDIKTRLPKPEIRAVQNPNFPNFYTFYAFAETNPGLTSEVNVRWRIDDFYFCGGQFYCYLAYKIYEKNETSFVEIAAPSYTCSGDNYYRELYYRKYSIQNLDTCVIYPPKLTITRYPDNPLKITIYDSSWGFNRGYISNSPASKMFFGDQDSLDFPFREVTHTYTQSGFYQVSIIYTAVNGCSKTFSTLVAVGNVSLPVVLQSFSAMCSSTTALIKWRTATEANSSHFEVQKSRNGVDGWLNLGIVKAAGTSNTPRNYSFTDMFPDATNFYRLKQVDKDNRQTYSPVERLSCNQAKTTMILFPSPATTTLSIAVKSEVEEEINFKVLDLTGRLYKRLNRFLHKGRNQIDINIAGLAGGTYILNIEKKGTTQTMKFLVK